MKEQKRTRSRADLTGTLSALLLMAAGAQASGKEISGKVVDIVDGDTLTLLTTDNWLIQVQLANIEAPEDSNPYGAQARQALSDLTLGKTATLQVYGRDPIGRSVAEVYVGKRNINLEMVRQGAARLDQQDPEPAPLHTQAGAKRALHGVGAPGNGFIRLEHRF